MGSTRRSFTEEYKEVIRKPLFVDTAVIAAGFPDHLLAETPDPDKNIILTRVRVAFRDITKYKNRHALMLGVPPQTMRPFPRIVWFTRITTLRKGHPQCIACPA